MFRKLTIADVSQTLFCDECDEIKDSDEVYTDDDRITTTYGSYTKTTGECLQRCKTCDNEIEITYDL